MDTARTRDGHGKDREGTRAPRDFFKKLEFTYLYGFLSLDDPELETTFVRRMMMDVIWMMCDDQT